jgi:voltage-gated potassium channel Kch
MESIVKGNTFLVATSGRGLSAEEIGDAISSAIDHKYGRDYSYLFQDFESAEGQVKVLEVPGGFDIDVTAQTIVDLPDQPGVYKYEQMRIKYKTGNK